MFNITQSESKNNKEVPGEGGPRGRVPSGMGPAGEGVPGPERPPVGELLARFDDLDEGWRSLLVRKELQQVYYEWLSTAAHWRSFITLTFKNERPPDVAYKYLLRLIQVANKDAFGKNYVQKVGHSYFNYLVGMEFQRRDVVHFHMLVDRPVHYELIHHWWNLAAGFVWIDGNIKDLEATLRYVTKYVCKSGDQNVNMFLKAKNKAPATLPAWWLQ